MDNFISIRFSSCQLLRVVKAVDKELKLEPHGRFEINVYKQDVGILAKFKNTICVFSS